MGKLRFTVLVLVLLFAVGCTREVYNTSNSKSDMDTSVEQDIPKAQNEDITHSDSKSEDVVQSEQKPLDNEYAESNEEKTVIEVTPEAPENVPELMPSTKETPKTFTGKVLDFDRLDKLDNTRYSWWFKKNNENKPTSIPENARKLIDGYNGVYIGDTSRKVIYLTFDEGYEYGYTGKILDTLKENEVKSIFFVTGPYIKKNPDLVKRMLDEGHLVGNHTINHPSLPSVDNPTLEKELHGLEEQFQAVFGTGFSYMRPPMGEYSERVLDAAKSLGYKTVFWSFAYRDFEVDNQKGADHAYKMVMDNLHNGAVILLHAVSRDNAEALDRIIKDVKEQGYTISPFDL